jgi:hypothetical protein
LIVYDASQRVQIVLRIAPVLPPAKVSGFTPDNAIKPRIELAAARVQLKSRQTPQQFGPHILQAIRDFPFSRTAGKGILANFVGIELIKGLPCALRLPVRDESFFAQAQIVLRVIQKLHYS